MVPYSSISDAILAALEQAGHPRVDVAEGSGPPDWDESVREAFYGDCMDEGIRAGLLLEALRRARHPRIKWSLQAGFDRAARRASRGGSNLDDWLARWGEMAGLSPSPVIDEATIDLHNEPVYEARVRFARAIIQRARARLVAFRRRHGGPRSSD